jgi:multidrug efflux pump subunit AcrA (membrane-fusion protein)
MATLAEKNLADNHSPRRMRRAGAGALLLLAASVAPGAATDGAKDAPARNPLASALSVSVKKARKMCFADKVELTGTLSARREVDVGVSRDGLVVTQVLVEPLDTVAPGQVLAQLSPMDGSGGGVAVRSTVSGVVGRSFAVVGMPVSARQGPLFRIIANGELELRAELPIDQLKKLAIGQHAAVRPLGLPETSGSVQFISPSVDPASQLGRARIVLTPGRPMRVGTFARGVVDVSERCGTGIPYSAIMYEPDGAIVHVVADNRVTARKVDMGLMAGKSVEIRSGLTQDDLVVVRAGPFLRDGDLVNPILLEDTAP